jgi:phosphoglycerate dehydrogenase-like enzyme/Na+/proline symporter
MTHYDYAVLLAYFALMLATGWIFRHFVSNVSDYFRGGGKAVWWLVGGSAFMVQFSAWTFTGAAGMAYAHGWPIIMIYVGNMIGFVLSALYFAPRFRQLRVITGLEAVRQRFGPASQQIFTWLQIPLGMLQAGIWLYALSKFFAAVLGIDITTTIITTGAVVLAIALLGGSWGVLASDFIQVLILLPVCAVLTVLSIAEVGGPAAFIGQLPAGHLDLGALFSNKFLALWCLAMLLKQTTTINNLVEASRFLAAKDNAHARKAAHLGAALFAVSILIWFIPPMAARILHPDLAAQFPNLHVTHVEEMSYIAIARGVLPAGMMGLLVSGIFASTMSSMDAGLNKNAGIFVKNFYHPIIHPAATGPALLRAGKITTLALGTIIILVALRMNTWEKYSLFLLTQRVSILISIPVIVPLFAGVLIKRTPAWAAWSTTLVSFIVAIFVESAPPVTWTRQSLDLGMSDAIITGEYWRQATEFLLIFVMGVAWFATTTLFWKKTAPAQKNRVAEFTARLDTPVDFDKEEGIASANDHRQAAVIGRLCIITGAAISLLALIPNPATGRLAFLFCAAIPLLTGAALHLRGRAPGNKITRRETRRKTILVALTPAECADFLPADLDNKLRALDATTLVHWNPAGHAPSEFHAKLRETSPEILLACWKTPALPPPGQLPPALRYVCYLCGSVKTLVTRAHLEYGLIVTNWGGSISRVVAECALHHVLSALRNATHWTLAMHCEGAWKNHETQTSSLFGRTIGIHGFGLVSKELIQLLRAFGVRITVCAPDLTPPVATAWQVARAATIDELFSSNEIIVELAPLTPETRGMIREKHLRLIRPGGAFINLGRGAVVDEAALIRVAKEGKINFGLDVFATEPLPPDHPLRGLRNVTLTPHLGGPTTDRRRDAGAFALANLRAYAEGRPPKAQVTPEIFDASS